MSLPDTRGLTPHAPEPGSDPPAEVASALAAAGARLGPFGEQLRWYAEVTSTNDVASRVVDAGGVEGSVVVADAQTAGRGRLGVYVVLACGRGIYVSVVLQPQPSVLPLITIAAGVAIAEGLADATGLRAALKWPNDVYVGGRKLGGILAEGVSASRSGAAAPALRLQHVILGFGINVSAAVYPPEVAARATSLESELGRAVDRGLVLAECLAALWRRYREVGRDDGAAVLRAWRDAAGPMLRRPVEWDHAGRVLRGVAEDVDGTGALIVRTASGRERIIAGEVRWL